MLHPHITSCPSKVFTDLSVRESELGCPSCHSLSQATPNTASPNQLINSWLFIQLRRWLSGSHSPSYLTFLRDAVFLMRPCHCCRDSGDDKLQGSEKKDHPGTMGMMGTILALLERGSPGRCWCFIHYLWNYMECQRGRCYPLSHHRSNIRRNMGITYFSFEHNAGLQKKGCPKTHGLQTRLSNVQRCVCFTT